MEPIFLDIETTVQDPEPFMVPDVATLEPPGTYKKPESIAEWRKEKAATLVDELRDASSLEPLLGGTVVCVVVARGAAAPVVVMAPTPDETGELFLLQQLEKGLQRYKTNPLVTWNGLSFDLPFLAKRALRHGLYALASRCHQDKPWGSALNIDLFKVWQQHDRSSKGRLSMVAQYLGIPSAPGEIMGRDVAAAIAAGDTAKVSAHCAADVERLRQIYWRMRAAGWVQGDDALPDELPVRPPRVSDRQALLNACAELQVSLDKASVKAAADAAGIAWTGDPPGEDGPVIDEATTIEQLKTFHRALRAKAAA